MNDDEIKLALEMADRRAKAGKMAVPCPACQSEQVQLTEWAAWPIKFKCRHCKHRFERNNPDSDAQEEAKL
ncbi:hypothetical protein AB4K08_00845 [Serratia fonticola]|uniref:hypothetical protein n=1 Tax=Serratia fonticola TaxID=47917 RepID=UPI0034C63D86